MWLWYIIGVGFRYMILAPVVRVSPSTLTIPLPAAAAGLDAVRQGRTAPLVHAFHGRAAPCRLLTRVGDRHGRVGGPPRSGQLARPREQRVERRHVLHLSRWHRQSADTPLASV